MGRRRDEAGPRAVPTLNSSGASRSQNRYPSRPPVHAKMVPQGSHSGRVVRCASLPAQSLAKSHPPRQWVVLGTASGASPPIASAPWWRFSQLSCWAKCEPPGPGLLFLLGVRSLIRLPEAERQPGCRDSPSPLPRGVWPPRMLARTVSIQSMHWRLLRG